MVASVMIQMRKMTEPTMEKKNEDMEKYYHIEKHSYVYLPIHTILAIKQRPLTSHLDYYSLCCSLVFRRSKVHWYVAKF